MSEVVYQTPRVKGSENETVVTSTCGHNCGGRCVVNAHVVDGRIRRFRPGPAGGIHHASLPACARGIGQVERTYHPDRLLYPMRRTGRGADIGNKSIGTKLSTRLPHSLSACARRTVTKPSWTYHVPAAYRCSMADLPPPFYEHVRRGDQSMVEHVCGSRGLLCPHDVRRQHEL